MPLEISSSFDGTRQLARSIVRTTRVIMLPVPVDINDIAFGAGAEEGIQPFERVCVCALGIPGVGICRLAAVQLKQGWCSVSIW